MEFIQGLLGLAALIAIVAVMRKAKAAASKALAQKVFLRTEYEEGKHILAGLTVWTTASIPEVMSQLRRHVVAADSPNAVIGRLYVALRTDDRIDYVYGNKLGDSFKVTVILTARGGMTVGVFKVLRRHEQDGVIVGEKAMADLRDQVMTACRAADSSARILEGIHDDELPAGKRETQAESAPLAPVSDPAGVAEESSTGSLPDVPPIPAAGENRQEPADPLPAPRSAGPNQPWSAIAVALWLLAVVWMALGVRITMLPIWFGVMAAAGLASYLSRRPARRRTVGDLTPAEGGVEDADVLEGATVEAMGRTADAGAQRAFDSPRGTYDSWSETQTAQEPSPAAAPAREAAAAAANAVKSGVGVARAWFSALSTTQRAFVLVAAAMVILVAGIAIGGAWSANNSTGASDGVAYEGDANNPGGTGGDYTPPEESASETGLTPNGQRRWRYATDIMDYGPEVGSSKYAAVTYSDALAGDDQVVFLVSSHALGAPGSDELWDVRLTSDDFEVCYIDEDSVSVEEFVTFVTSRPSTAGSIYYMRSGISTFKAYSDDHIPPDYVPPGGEGPRDSMAQIADLFAGAPQDGSGGSVTRKVFYLPSDSVMGESVAFSTDDPSFTDPYSIWADELTNCYIGDEKVSTTQFLENVVGGMYHTGTITYTDDTIVEIRIVME